VLPLTRAPSVPRVVGCPSPLVFPDEVLTEAYKLMLGGGDHPVYLIRSAEECDVLLAKLLKEEEDEDKRLGVAPNSIRVIGFDCEWRPGIPIHRSL
jgi:hypothetical protein